MLPWGEYPRPKGSFPVSIPAITTEPDDDTTRVVVSFSRDWLEVIRGSITQLFLQSTWGLDRAGTELQRQRVVRLLELLGEEVMVIQGVRQNAALSCILEYTTDGVAWTPFADLQLCPPLLRTTSSGQTQRYYDNGSGFGWYTVDQGAPPTNLFDDFTASYSQANNTNNVCTAAANAANVIRQLFSATGTSLVAEVSGQAAAWIVSAGGILLSLVGAEIGPALLATVAGTVATLQTLYGAFTMSPQDFHDLTCIFRNNMTGSAPTYTFNFSAINTAVVAKQASSPATWTLIKVLLDFIGNNGIIAASRTTAIASYDCTAHTEYIHIATTKVKQGYGTGLNSLNLFDDSIPTATFAFTRAIMTLPSGATWTPQAANGLPPGGANVGRTDTSSILPAGTYWTANSNIFATDAAAKTAISLATGIAAASIANLLRINQNGNQGKLGWNWRLNTVGGVCNLTYDSWYFINFAAC